MDRPAHSTMLVGIASVISNHNCCLGCVSIRLGIYPKTTSQFVNHISSKGDFMFTELMPLIKTRPLTITIAVEGDSRVRLNVVPKPIAKDKAANEKIGHAHNKEVAPIPDEAIHALTTPLSITGTPEEVDAGLCDALTKFAASHQTLQQSFNDAAANIANAVKVIDERERIKKEK